MVSSDSGDFYLQTTRQLATQVGVKRPPTRPNRLAERGDASDAAYADAQAEAGTEAT